MGNTESKPHWVLDKDVTQCTQCSVEFGIFTRRHHCRSCGKIFCDPCTSYKAYVPGHDYKKGTKQRVCSDCNKLPRQDEKEVKEEKIEEKKEIEEIEEIDDRDSIYESDTSPPFRRTTEQRAQSLQSTDDTNGESKPDKQKKKKGEKNKQNFPPKTEDPVPTIKNNIPEKDDKKDSDELNEGEIIQHIEIKEETNLFQQNKSEEGIFENFEVKGVPAQEKDDQESIPEPTKELNEDKEENKIQESRDYEEKDEQEENKA